MASSTDNSSKRLSSTSTLSTGTKNRLSSSGASIFSSSSSTTGKSSFAPPSYVSPLILKRIRQIDTGIRYDSILLSVYFFLVILCYLQISILLPNPSLLRINYQNGSIFWRWKYIADEELLYL